MPLPQNPNAEMEWINTTGFPITITAEGYEPLTLQPGDKSPALPLLISDNSLLRLQLSRADDSTVSNSTEIRWNQQDGGMAVTQRAADLGDSLMRVVDANTQGYHLYLSTDSDNGGILIVGTIDIK